MIRLTRQADYSIVVMTQLARAPEGTSSARELATAVHLSLPMVSKILKALVRGGLLDSHRGAHGGYSLAVAPDEVSVARIITAVEGPIGMTDCSGEEPSCCDIEHQCPVRSNWQVINEVVRQALDRISLAQMATPLSSELLSGRARTGEPLPQAAPWSDD